MRYGGGKKCEPVTEQQRERDMSSGTEEEEEEEEEEGEEEEEKTYRNPICTLSHQEAPFDVPLHAYRHLF